MANPSKQHPGRQHPGSDTAHFCVREDRDLGGKVVNWLRIIERNSVMV